MKTGQEMYEYSEKNHFGTGMFGWGQKSFEVVAKHLLPDEEVLICFIGIHYDMSGYSNGNFAFAITNKRLILGQKKVFGEIVQSINLCNFNDITLSAGALLGYITFDFFKECFQVGFSVDDAKNLYHHLDKFFADFKKSKHSNSDNNQTDIVAELRKYKQLFDEGVISQEEFDAKKKQILGL